MAKIKLLRGIMPCIVPQPSFRLAIIDIDEKQAVKDVDYAGPRLSFSYYKLPEALLKLSVLKLDGSCFDVKVASAASVAELKQAVEDVFNQAPSEDQSKISWSHVWGHFCLCYKGYKLVNDKEPLTHLRIKDGDQLRFIRHLSIHQAPPDQPKKRVKSHGQRISSAGSDDNERELEDDQTHGKYSKDNHKIHSIKTRDEFKLVQTLKKWLSMRSKRKVHFHRLASNNYLRDQEAKMRFARLQNSP